MKILFVVPPVLFKKNPLIGLAYLCAYLKDSHEVKVYDINTLENIVDEEREDLWSNESYVRKYISDNKDKFEKWSDEIIENKPDIVGFTLWETTRYASLELAGLIKKKSGNIKIVFGGPDVSFSWERIKGGEVDAYVFGEGEATFREIVDNYAAGGISKNI